MSYLIPESLKEVFNEMNFGFVPWFVDQLMTRRINYMSVEILKNHDFRFMDDLKNHIMDYIRKDGSFVLRFPEIEPWNLYLLKQMYEDRIRNRLGRNGVS